jgi:hypothetical protein
MDFTEVLSALNKATLFDLHRLQSAIYQELSNPKRLDAIKVHLKVGKQISYFDSDLNRLIDAVVVKPKKTLCLVKHVDDGKMWNIPIYYINLDNVDTDIKADEGQRGIAKAVLKVWDRVGFKGKEEGDLYGEVIRLNQKTATIRVDQYNQWRVSYALLFPVLDGEQAEQAGGQTLLPGVLADIRVMQSKLLRSNDLKFRGISGRDGS